MTDTTEAPPCAGSGRSPAKRVADVLERFGFTPEQAEQVEPYVWAMAGELAGQEDTPDEVTRRSVVTELRSRRDPFHGFPLHDDTPAWADRIARNEDMATMAGELDQ